MIGKGFAVHLILIMAFCLAPGAAFAQPGALGQSASRYSTSGMLPVKLLLDGHPLLSKEHPQFSCYDETRQKWFNCSIQADAGNQCHVMDRPAPGQYRMHVSIDENRNNPKSYPGDYEAIYRFEVTANSPDTLFIDVPQVIHLNSPGDNDRSLEGIFDACQSAPGFEAPFFPYAEPPRFTFHGFQSSKARNINIPSIAPAVSNDFAGGGFFIGLAGTWPLFIASRKATRISEGAAKIQNHNRCAPKIAQSKLCC